MRGKGERQLTLAGWLTAGEMSHVLSKDCRSTCRDLEEERVAVFVSVCWVIFSLWKNFFFFSVPFYLEVWWTISPMNWLWSELILLLMVDLEPRTTFLFIFKYQELNDVLVLLLNQPDSAAIVVQLIPEWMTPMSQFFVLNHLSLCMVLIHNS